MLVKIRQTEQSPSREGAALNGVVGPPSGWNVARPEEGAGGAFEMPGERVPGDMVERTAAPRCPRGQHTQ